MIGLPLKRTYLIHAAIRTLCLPAHDLDHNCTDGYTDEVEEEIEQKIWAKIKKAVDSATADSVHFTPTQVQSEFVSIQSHFRAQIAARGTRSNGTAIAYSQQGSTTNGWWLAFSMAKKSVASIRPIATL